MSGDPHALKPYIDGSCYDNPGGAGAYACVAQFPDVWGRPDELLFEEGFHETTNQRMELSACIRAFAYIAEHGDTQGVQRVIIVTDSLYLYDNWQRAVVWRRNEWKNSYGRPIEDSDLWRRFLSVRKRVQLRTDIVWQKGKKSPVLKAVDRAAKAAGKNPRKNDYGFRGGKIARSHAHFGSASMYPARGQVAIIRVYRSALLRKTGHKITFDVFSDDLGALVQKFFAYTEAAIANQLHRQHCYEVKFNRNSKFPQIEEIVTEQPCPKRHSAP